MVCNVNGPDGFLTVRKGPGTSYEKVRAFERLAVLRVDITQRQGRWVRVIDGSRSVRKTGESQAYRHLPVEGWVHDGYLCSFLY